MIFHFMNTHPPIEHIQSVTLSLYIYFGWFMGREVGGDGVVGGFIGWMGGACGWLKGSKGGGVAGWRVHGVGGCVVVGWVVGGFMGWVYILTHS